MAKPTSTPDWINDDDVTKITTPSGAKQLEGWLPGEKPPYQYFNWFWNLCSKWLQWFDSRTPEWNIVIDSAANEGDYLTLAAYLADAPASGDRVFIALDEVTTSKITIPAGIKLKFKKGNKITCASDLATVIEFGDDCTTEGDFELYLTHTGTTAEAVSINGHNNNHQNIIVNNTSTGTVTAAIILESGKAGNYVNGEVINSGGGTITAVIDDSSGVTSNNVSFRDRDSGLITNAVDLSILNGGTGASTASAALANLGLTATAAEVNTACDGILATAAEINLICDGCTVAAVNLNSLYAHRITGDGVGLSLRSIRLRIVDGTNASTLEVNTSNRFNSVTISAEDNLPKSGNTTSFFLSPSGGIIQIYATALGHTPDKVLCCNIVYDDSGLATIHTVSALALAGYLQVAYQDNAGLEVDLTAIAGSDSILVDVLYLTTN